jgi:hypothetical protein
LSTLAVKLANSPAYSDTLLGIAVWAHVSGWAIFRSTINKEAVLRDWRVTRIAVLRWIGVERRIPAGHVQCVQVERYKGQFLCKLSTEPTALLCASADDR